MTVNLYKQNTPLIGKVIENRRLTAATRSARNDVRHLVIRYDGKYPYVPGQSVGILPPGIDSRTGKPNHLRLYSIASERRGDDGSGQSVSLCVVRHFWDDPKTGKKETPGTGSQYLCDLKPGDEVKMTGPAGKHFVVPEDSRTRDIIFAATGTGIAPYRGMLIELFRNSCQGDIWLFFGVPYGDTILYDDEFRVFEKQHTNFHYVKAVSREETNPFAEAVPTRQNKMYVQVRMYEHREALKTVLSKPDSLIYLCGLKGMEAGIFPILDKIGREAAPGTGDSLVECLKREKRLLVEVY